MPRPQMLVRDGYRHTAATRTVTDQQSYGRFGGRVIGDGIPGMVITEGNGGRCGKCRVGAWVGC